MVVRKPYCMARSHHPVCSADSIFLQEGRTAVKDKDTLSAQRCRIKGGSAGAQSGHVAGQAIVAEGHALALAAQQWRMDFLPGGMHILQLSSIAEVAARLYSHVLDRMLNQVLSLVPMGPSACNLPGQPYTLAVAVVLMHCSSMCWGLPHHWQGTERALLPAMRCWMPTAGRVMLLSLTPLAVAAEVHVHPPQGVGGLHSHNTRPCGASVLSDMPARSHQVYLAFFLSHLMPIVDVIYLRTGCKCALGVPACTQCPTQ